MITNNANGKKYVGITTRSLSERFEEHCNANSYLGSAIRKHGRDNFVIKIIDIASNHKELNEKEKSWIKKYDTFGENGYNLTLGGDGMLINVPIVSPLTASQEKFMTYLNKQKGKPVDFESLEEVVKMILENLIGLYLESRNARDKISCAQLILKLRPNYFKSIVNSKIISEEEIIHYAKQSLPTFKELIVDG